jgi:hypothetical protein
LALLFGARCFISQKQSSFSIHSEGERLRALALHFSSPETQAGYLDKRARLVRSSIHLIAVTI